MAGKTVQGTCDAHDLLVSNVDEIKTDIKDIKKDNSEIKTYIITKQAENGFEKYTVQSRDTKWGNIRGWGILIIAIIAILVSLYNIFLVK